MRGLRGWGRSFNERKKLMHELVYEERDAHASEGGRWICRKSSGDWIEQYLIRELEIEIGQSYL